MRCGTGMRARRPPSDPGLTHPIQLSRHPTSTILERPWGPVLDADRSHVFDIDPNLQSTDYSQRATSCRNSRRHESALPGVGRRRRWGGIARVGSAASVEEGWPASSASVGGAADGAPCIRGPLPRPSRSRCVGHRSVATAGWASLRAVRQSAWQAQRRTLQQRRGCDRRLEATAL